MEFIELDLLMLSASDAGFYLWKCSSPGEPPISDELMYDEFIFASLIVSCWDISLPMSENSLIHCKRILNLCACFVDLRTFLFYNSYICAYSPYDRLALNMLLLFRFLRAKCISLSYIFSTTLSSPLSTYFCSRSLCNILRNL